MRAFSGRILVAVLVCALVMTAAVYRANQYIDDEVAKIPRLALTTATEASATGQNFLIVGSDSRSFVKNEGQADAFTDSTTTVDGPARSDTMMVLHADGANSYAVSFPRDLWVNIPGRGDLKLNAAFNDGPQKVIDTITANFGVPINHYLEVNFATFADIVEAVGAVPVYFPYPARDEYSGLTETWVAGCYRLNGQAALAYVRSRHLEYKKDGKWVDASPMADLDRIDRQQSFVKKLGKIAVAHTMDDPLIAPDLADKVIPKLVVDDSFDRSSFNALVNAFMGLADGEGGLTFVTLPWDGPATRGGQSVLLVKQPDADAVFAILKGEVPPPSATTTTAAGSTGGTGGDDGATCGAAPGRRAGAGDERLGRVGRGGQRVAGPLQPRLRSRHHRQRHPRHRGQDRGALPPGRRGQGPARGQRGGRGHPGGRLVALGHRRGAGGGQELHRRGRQPHPHHHGRRRRDLHPGSPPRPRGRLRRHRRIGRTAEHAGPGSRGRLLGRRVRLPTLPGMSWSTGSPLRAFLGRFVISLVVASLVVTAVVVVANREINDRIAKIPRIELALASPPPEGANFLLIGSDTRAFVDNADDAAKFGDAQSEGGQRSDTIMVAHVEPDSQRTFVVSFPRDLIVNIPGYGRGMINSAYSLANGDPQLLINTLDANFGIKINHYVQVDFQSFRSVVETIGQVWVYIPGKMRDQYSGLSTPYGAGCFPLNGEAALSYVRARDLEIADPNGNIVDDDGTRWRQYDLRADLDRIPRQQSFIRRLTGLAISKSLGDPTIAFELADNVLQYLTVDQNLGRSEINALVRAFRTVDVNDSSSLQMVTLPVVADPNDRNRVIPADDADTVVAALNTFGASTPKALPAPSQVTVDVVDGSGRDLGAGIVKTLGDYGLPGPDSGQLGGAGGGVGDPLRAETARRGRDGARLPARGQAGARHHGHQGGEGDRGLRLREAHRAEHHHDRARAAGDLHSRAHHHGAANHDRPAHHNDHPVRPALPPELSGGTGRGTGRD